ncbi:MAG: type II secretion system protein [Candidatus Saccharibacteria bacterium]
MKRSHGFTLIELLITITVMVILLTLAVANLRNSQSLARDEDRKTDVQNIARTLDSLYTTGYSFTGSTSTLVTFKGEYPAIDQMTDPDVRAQIFKDIPVTSRASVDSDPGNPDSFIMATATTASNTTVTGYPNGLVTPAPFPNQYIYEPLATDGSLCTTAATMECRRFIISYKLEAVNLVYTIESKNQ